MRNDLVRVFLGGDVFASVGLRCALSLLPRFIEDNGIDCAVMNGENASLGVGISEADARSLFAAGVDAITGGNHTFEKRDFWPALDALPRLLRPANYPSDAGLPGRGAVAFSKGGHRFAVLNLQGREDMTAIDCPFRAADAQLKSWAEESEPPLVLVDFHAESNQEKEALGLHLAGRAVAVVGTHTHVQTADERVIRGTAYMTDLGMTGALSSVIGSDPAFAVKRNVTQVLYKLEPYETVGALRGLIVDVDPVSREAVAVTRVCLPEAART